MSFFGLTINLPSHFDAMATLAPNRCFLCHCVILLSSLAACGVAQRARSAEKHALGMTSNLLPLDCDMPAVGSACARREEGERGTSRPSFQALTIPSLSPAHSWG